MKVIETNVKEIRDLIESQFEYYSVDSLERGITDLDVEFEYYIHRETGLVSFNEDISDDGTWDTSRMFTVNNICNKYYHRLYQFGDKDVTTRLIDKELLFGREELFQNNLFRVNKYVARYILEHGEGKNFVSFIADIPSEEEIYYGESGDSYRSSGTATRSISTSEKLSKTKLGKEAYQSLFTERKKILDLCQNIVLISFRGYALEEK